MLFRSDRKSTRLNSSHTIISYAVFCLKKKKNINKKTIYRRVSNVSLTTQVRRTRVSFLLTDPSTILLSHLSCLCFSFFFFFFNDTATTEIYTLSLHDALPIFGMSFTGRRPDRAWAMRG